LKIRIFALAKELGFESKDLIQHCNDAGLDVKSSPLASITPEERDVLMDHLKSIKGGSKASAPSVEAAVVPAREDVRREQQVREIRDLGPLAGSIRSRRAPRKESAFAPEAEVVETPSAPAAVEVAPPVIEHPAAVSAPASPGAIQLEKAIASAKGKSAVAESIAVVEPEAPPTVAPAAKAVPEVPAAVAAVEPSPAGMPAPGAFPTASPEGHAERPPISMDHMRSRPSPMSRTDYIAPGGVGGGGQIREMRPHGSVRAEEDRSTSRQAKKRGPTLPALATPTFKLPVPKKVEEEPVQRPTLALTGDLLRKNKLSEILRKNRDESKKTTIEEEETVAKGKQSRTMGLEEAREARRRRRQKTRTPGEEDESVIVKSPKRARRGAASVERKSSATISLPVTVRTLSEAMGRPARDLITTLFKQGRMITINDTLDEETAVELAMDLGVDLTIEHDADFEDVLKERRDHRYSAAESTLVSRPPIITVLGHVDHGKTTLVDKIRSSNVVAGEAGGITQHIAAYQVTHGDHKLTFVDTPGHAAFGEMRARGANVTDIIVLVVAADDGVMPQTVECISHAKAAGVPIIVAMNKCDLPNINEQKVLTELSQHGILPSEWGGDVEVVRTSGLTGKGVDDLLETIVLTAELQELSAPIDCQADGVCLEAFRDEGRGPLAWVIVRRGTLRVGDIVLCGTAYGRIRAMYSDRDAEVAEAGPSTPVKIAGLASVPGAGDHLFVMDDIDEARQIAEERRLRGRTTALSGRGGPLSLEEFFATRDGKIKDLPLIIKADTPGSIEAIRGELGKFSHDEVRIKILHEGVGGVNESDIYLAASAGAIIIAFHVVAEDRAEVLAQQEGVEIRRYKIIYNVIDDIRQALEGLLEPEQVEVATGRALVLRTFPISRVGTVAGCRVLNGTIDRNSRIHLIRDQTILNSYGIASLKREKDDVREVREGFECGIRLDGFNDVKEGHLLEAYKIEQRKRSLNE